MSSAPSRKRIFRLSLRELLVLVTLVALAITSLKHASDVWLALVLAVTMIALFVGLIVAVIDRGPRQAFAIGFVLVLAAYGIMLASIRSRELDQWQGRLPTTRLLRYIHMAVDDSRWIDHSTGQEVPDYDPDALQAHGGPFGTSTVWRKEIPPRAVFMPIGHCWWALLLAYLGGWFASYVYMRRMREQASAA